MHCVHEMDVWCKRIDNFMLTMHKTLLIDWLTYVQNILQPSF